MTDAEMKRVIELDEQGCRILYRSQYVDTFAHIYEENGRWVLSSQVWRAIPLRDIDLNCLTFWKEVYP